MKLALLTLLTATTALGALPSVGPDYQRPTVDVPAAYRSADQPSDQTFDVPSDRRGTRKRFSESPQTPHLWWTLFQDPTLDRLETQALSANQDLKAAAARVAESYASAGIARAAYSPQITLNPSATRTQTSTTAAFLYPQPLYNDFNVPVLATWEIDLFGRVRRLNESARADAEASAALFESVRLSLTASVASNYFTLRGLDRESNILRETVDLRRRELKLVTDQRRFGAATDLDTSRAETELASTEAEAADVAARRESAQGALAVLVGEGATTFSLAPSDVDIALPEVPPGIPSQLLQRRPDIVAAERSLAAANARIGVAKAAFFPAISLTGSAGFDSSKTDSLFGADSRIWSIGPSVYLPIFQGGRNQANLDRSRAAYDESVATYRQQVLVAFREVEEDLAVSRLLSKEWEAQARAVSSAKRAASLAQTRYKAGYVSYLDVVDAQRTELGNERAAAQLFAQRFNTDVALIKALGGGWSI